MGKENLRPDKFAWCKGTVLGVGWWTEGIYSPRKKVRT